HAGREVAPGIAEHDDNPAGHVFAAMIARALDHGDGAGVAHREALAGDAAEITLALDGAVEHGVADNDRLFGHDACLARRVDDDASAREALADVVVGLAFQLEGNAARKPRAETLAGGADELHVNRIVREPGVAVDFGDLAGKHGAGGAVGVADRGLDLDRRAPIDRGAGIGDQLAVEHALDHVVLRLAPIHIYTPSPPPPPQHARQLQPPRP